MRFGHFSKPTFVYRCIIYCHFWVLWKTSSRMLSAAASGWNAELGLWSSKDPRGWVDAMAHSVEFDECQWLSSKDMVISANS